MAWREKLKEFGGKAKEAAIKGEHFAEEEARAGWAYAKPRIKEGARIAGEKAHEGWEYAKPRLKEGARRAGEGTRRLGEFTRAKIKEEMAREARPRKQKRAKESGNFGGLNTSGFTDAGFGGGFGGKVGFGGSSAYGGFGGNWAMDFAAKPRKKSRRKRR